ncbi:SDR family NAD(P)-dependent oxidoreductase [Photobacterium galatheae]|uniref:Short-chain dehydrogenase n=1 Tax=Photobacterium galatheae TaxID=1654360 RepID=A0A066RVJ3_9GAMM|nr:SDR family oxidoreductase [Photobacterium galatheae]KDM93116.1 short-chain dehydrogenase [Photobacterium galatheae]MCM0148356.1 SDR family oxidoreductase [Photobacterium galatheae]
MNGKTILVTGGTSGIGKALAEHLVNTGHRVIITGRNQDRINQVAQTLGCTGYVADSANPAQLKQLAATLQSDNIRLDGLVLNAGVFYPGSILTTTEEAFDLTMNINTKGPWFTLQQLHPILNNPSSVVFVSSIAVTNAFASAAIYSASKAAFEAIARVANLEFAADGIRINAVRPGVTATEIQSKAGMTTEQQKALFASLDQTALGRVLSPDDQIGAIAFLLSDQSIAMRNAVLEVSGGYGL